MRLSPLFPPPFFSFDPDIPPPSNPPEICEPRRYTAVKAKTEVFDPFGFDEPITEPGFNLKNILMLPVWPVLGGIALPIICAEGWWHGSGFTEGIADFTGSKFLGEVIGWPLAVVVGVPLGILGGAIVGIWNLFR